MLVSISSLLARRQLTSPSTTGKSSADKLKELRESLERSKARAMVVSMLDEVAWLFNLRASDISYNPGEASLLSKSSCSYFRILRLALS
jgi:hypothetical protein